VDDDDDDYDYEDNDDDSSNNNNNNNNTVNFLHVLYQAPLYDRICGNEVGVTNS
jgi:hypothetical protein